MASRDLLLVSLGLGAVTEFVGGDPAGKRLAFVPDAGVPYEDRSFVDRDRSLLSGMGFDLLEVTLEGRTAEELRTELADVDVVFVAGGNSFYLLEKALASGFGEVLGELLDHGVKYIGASAGAIMVGPDLRPVSTLDDPAEAPGLESLRGLGLVDFVVLPHYGNEKYLPEYEAIMRRYEGELTLLPLRNDQAVWVRGDKYEVTGSAE
ncbi:Type 1 glutamine amidotransferase-like domain-containing protein [Streptomyces sp. NPDC020731]|uniref:Type 1 glutamine amidotransferase-like domain-containing protein n=1 Tax=Streptomyces sp. NPDC020731 TaxID=3365085 RepID=UPI0037A502EA